LLALALERDLSPFVGSATAGGRQPPLPRQATG